MFYYITMRIISGKYRGKKLKEFNLDTTKPTTDKVKESIFNMIQFDCFNAVVLDLFAGTGALGIEALSRGAKFVDFVDLNKQAIKIINENLHTIQGDYLISNLDYNLFLKNTTRKYDIVLLDPPYKTDYGIHAIDTLIENNLLNNNAIIIFETAEDNKIELTYSNFDIIKKRYGTISVFKLTKKD